jgi:hypothetical protein
MWLREDGTPYYVGKGHDKRAFNKKNHRQFPPPDLSRILVQEFPDEASAFAAEKFFITFFGRVDLGTGCLRNMTDGGEGHSNPSQETRQKISIGNRRIKPRRVKLTAETRRRMSEAQKGNQKFLGHNHSTDTRRKMSKPKSETHRHNMRKPKSAAHREAIRKSWVARKASHVQKD